MNTQYKVLLNGHEIGYTELEYGDPPMGVVFGKLVLPNVASDYDFVRNYCLEKGMELVNDDIDDGIISTGVIPNLEILLPSGEAIPSQGAFIFGGLNELEINIWYIPYPFYEEAFPHHVKRYNEMFS